MEEPKATPPRLAGWILNLILPGKDAPLLRDEFADIYEETVTAEGRGRANRWYWMQLLKTAPSFITHTCSWRISMFKNYFKIALRNMIKNRGFTFINTSGLAIGMAVCILIFLWVEDEINTNRFHERVDDIYLAAATTKGVWSSTTPWALAATLKKDFAEVEMYSHIRQSNWSTRYEDKQFYEQGILVDADFFKMFSFPLLKGSADTIFPSPNSIVITEEFAVKYFGNEDPMGKILTIENQYNLAVTGVVKKPPSNSQIQFDYLVPVELVGEQRLNSWSWESSSYLLLKENVDQARFSEKIAGTIMKYDKRTQMQTEAGIFPLKRVYLYGINGRGPITYVYIFISIALIVLLIACINFMNLSTARSVKRSREVGMRKVIGAARGELMRQFLGESLLLTFIAFLISIVLVKILLPEFNNLAGKELSLNLFSSALHLAGFISIFLFTGMISGSYPALYLSSFNPAKVLKGSQGTGFSRNILRKALVVIQFVAAVVLIICTIVVYSQLNYIWNKDLGFDKEQIVSVTLNQQTMKSYDTIRNELLKNSDIVSVCVASSMPLEVGNINPAYWEGKTADDYVTINWVSMDYDYFKTFNMEFVQGRPFSKEFSTDDKNYVINEAALRLTGLEDPIGKLFSIWTAEGKIIGVVKDFHSQSLHNNYEPIAFTMQSKWAQRLVMVKMKPERVQEAMAFIRKQFKAFAPEYHFRYTFLDEAFGRQYEAEKRIGSIFKYFTILAIFISCLGLFGLASFMAEQRTKEIGIRKVLGASVRGIITMLSTEFVKWVLISSLIAFPIAYFTMNNWLKNFAFHTSISIWIFVISALLSALIAVLTVSFQSFRAASANPADSLKYE